MNPPPDARCPLPVDGSIGTLRLKSSCQKPRHFPAALKGLRDPSAVPAYRCGIFGESLFVFVWLSDDRRLAVIVRFVVVLLFVIVIVGVAWRQGVSGEARQSENALGYTW